MFSGDTFEPEHDAERLSTALAKVRELMLDGKWRTLFELAAATKIPEASASARLRDLRKRRFGFYLVNRRPRGPRSLGLFEYRVQSR